MSVMSTATYDPQYRNLLDWAEARRVLGIDTPPPLPDDVSRQAVDWIDAFLDLAEAFPLASPPATLLPRLHALFVRRGRRCPPVIQLMTRVADSRRSLELAGVRGPEWTGRTTFHLVFDGPSATIFVEVNPSGPTVMDLTGQVLPEEDGPAVFDVIARTPLGSSYITSSDDNGGFRFAGLPIDATCLELEKDDLVLIIELDLDEPRP